MSRVTAIISALVICIIVCLSWAVNHYLDNAITYKAQRDKNARELKLANAAITDMQMRQRDVAALDAKYTKELADAKAENDALHVMSIAAGRRGCTLSSLTNQCVKPPPPPAWIMQPPPDWQEDYAETGLFHPQRLITMQKQLEGPRGVLMSDADRVAISMGNSCKCVTATRFQRSINAKVIKPEAIHLRMFAGLYFFRCFSAI